MPHIAPVEKIGERLGQALKLKGATTQQAMDSVGGRTLPTWYRWINGEQQGGCRDITMLGVFLGLRPDELLLDDETASSSESSFNLADRVGIENLRRMLAELNSLSEGANSEARPVAILNQHVQNLLTLMKQQKPIAAKAPAKKSRAK